MSLCLEGKLRRPVIDWLRGQQATPVFEVHYCDIVGVEWGERIGRPLPPILRIISVELKLHDVADVLRQCESNRNRFPECWAAMPDVRVSKMKHATLEKFYGAGVGLMSVSLERGVIVELAVQPKIEHRDTQHMRRNLWRRRDEWKNRIDKTRF